MDLAPNVRDLSKITTEEISADLDYLASKHPEMFSKPSDVFRLIREIKNEPTHFFNNYRLDYALVAKRLNDKKIGKLAIDKENGEVRHATKVRERDLARMDRVSKQTAGTSTLPTPLSTANNNVLKQDATSVGKTYSSANQSIIPQNKNLINPRLKTNLEAIQDDTNKFINTVFKGKISAQDIEKIDPKLFNYVKKFAKAYYEKESKNIVEIEANNLTKQEKRGIYNVTYNEKFSTPVYKDLKDVDNAIKYAKGDKSKGAKHISIRHLNDDTKEGYVTRQELLSLGENIRAYLKENKEPFIDKRGGHIYEWEDKDGVRFRAVIGQAKRESDDRSITSTLKPTDEATKKGLSPNSSLDNIITFYSDRNLKEPMKFENPKLKLLDAIDNSNDKVGVVKKVLLNKDISESVKAKAVNKLSKNKFAQISKGTYISTKNSQNN